MKLASREVAMTCSLELNERETQMLNHLAEFKGSEVASAICQGITKEYKMEEWDNFFSNLRAQTESSVRVMRDTRYVFLGIRKAVSNDEAPTPADQPNAKVKGGQT